MLLSLILLLPYTPPMLAQQPIVFIGARSCACLRVYVYLYND